MFPLFVCLDVGVTTYIVYIFCSETSPPQKRRVQTVRLGDLPKEEKKELLGDNNSPTTSDFDYDQAAKAERLRDLTARTYITLL